ncbi:AAA family ATPase [Neobacillus sp. Marseille-QA0830]
MNYRYPEGYKGHTSFIWDRCIGHTLTEDSQDGILLPYHEVLAYQKETQVDLNYRDYIALAPDRRQFSYASELVEHDTALDALFNMATALKNASQILESDFTRELNWIDDRIAEIWDMRGAFPGMGPVLAALGFENANAIAWEIEKYILHKHGDLLAVNPWDIFEKEMTNPGSILKEKGMNLITPTNRRLWKLTSKEKKEFILLLSRAQMTNEQAAYVVKNHNEKIGSISQIFENPYILYENTRFIDSGLSFQQVDKAILPVEKVRLAFPVPKPAEMEDFLDERRVRALEVNILEHAASLGHSLLPEQEVLERIAILPLDPPCPINEDILSVYRELDFYKESIIPIQSKDEKLIIYHKLKRLVVIKKVINTRINKEIILKRTFSIKHDWLSLINNYPVFRERDAKKNPTEKDLLARKEKAEALNILSNYRFSVLIGPAGSGKTTLLKIFEEIPEIKAGGVLKLAPTGKARVKLGHNAKTVAQFLYTHKRYDGKTGHYFINPEASKYTGCRTVIIDEASMLSEEQLAAVFDALGSVERIILVGDYRQLPPIGTGRPFMDIVKLFQPEKFEDENLKMAPAYAELIQILRQDDAGNVTEDRIDVVLSRCFGDRLNKHDLDRFYELYAQKQGGEDLTPNLRLVKWYDSTDLHSNLGRILREELELEEAHEEHDFNLRIGAKDVGDYQYFNSGFAEKEIENWQILSPINGYGYGVKEINKHIQTKYRKSFIDLAYNIQPENSKFFVKRKVAKPKGSDNIVYGDKVINLKNTVWGPDRWIKPMEKKAVAMNYIANGEIGVLTGEFRGKNSNGKGEPKIEISFSTQPGYSYVFFPNELSEDGNQPMELAYCISVHKAQGSGFKKVFFILPASSPILSRELLYTALTRQEEKIIILHQGDFEDFLRFTSDEFSETAGRLTDLFYLPNIKEINNKRLDSRYVNVSERGEYMISKNEVIIANCLYKYEKQGVLTYGYENKLKMNDGLELKPDFTIDYLPTGQKFYWEHLGMMTLENYREKWQRKLNAYLKSGFVLHTEASLEDDKVLIITEENPNGGINSQKIDQLVRNVILNEE